MTRRYPSSVSTPIPMKGIEIFGRENTPADRFFGGPQTQETELPFFGKASLVKYEGSRIGSVIGVAGTNYGHHGDQIWGHIIPLKSVSHEQCDLVVDFASSAKT